MIKIRPATTDQAQLLSQLALRSKAYWGYDEKFMQQCANELSHSPADINNCKNLYYVAEVEGTIVGFYKLCGLNKTKIQLEALFIDSLFIGKGFGRTLLDHAIATAKQVGGKTLSIQSDPFAEAFYLSMGGKTVGKVKSNSIPNRFLPMIEIPLFKAVSI